MSDNPIVETWTTAGSDAVVPALGKVFRTMGTAQSLEKLRVDHRGPVHAWLSVPHTWILNLQKITPHYGEVEWFVKVIDKTLKTPQVLDGPFQQELNVMLRNKRRTPPTATTWSGYSEYLLLSRTIRYEEPTVT